MSAASGKMRIGVLASGRGSNFTAVCESIERGDIDADVVVLVCNKPGAGVIEAARVRGIETVVIESAGKSPGEFDRKVVEILKLRGVELVLLTGFMRIVGKTILDAFPLRIMNIHPSLLPSFAGLDAQKQALEYGIKIAGCTVHFVDAGVDTGPIILQRSVPVLDDDTVETLSKRILAEEHRAYPQAVKLFVEGKLRIEGRKVLIGGEE